MTLIIRQCVDLPSFGHFGAPLILFRVKESACARHVNKNIYIACLSRCCCRFYSNTMQPGIKAALALKLLPACLPACVQQLSCASATAHTEPAARRRRWLSLSARHPLLRVRALPDSPVGSESCVER
jgi:hypothetical protein